MSRAKTRNKLINEYYEKHHIIPKCIGGLDTIDNIAFLSAREHFIAHQILVKIFPDHIALVHAARMMCVKSKNHNFYRSKNRMYEWLRLKHKKIMKNNIGVKNHQYGTIWVHNKDLLINSKINKTNVELYINQGRIIGRVLKWKNYKFVEKNTTLKKLKNKTKRDKAPIEKISMYNMFGLKKRIPLKYINEYINQNWSISNRHIKVTFCVNCGNELKKDQKKYCSILCYNHHHGRQPKITTVKKHTYQKGERNSQYGKRFVWMYNTIENKNAHVAHNDVEKFLNLGWKKGKIQKQKILPCRVL